MVEDIKNKMDIESVAADHMCNLMHKHVKGVNDRNEKDTFPEGYTIK
jgi:hypothetical protein